MVFFLLETTWYLSFSKQTIQNHLEISSKTQFWTRNVRNWTKSRDLVMSGPVQEDPYGPIWALMGPPGQVLAGPDMPDFRLLVEFCMFWVQICFLMKFLDDSAWFCVEESKNIVFLQKNIVF